MNASIKTIFGVSAVVSSVLFSGIGVAQTYPDRPVTLVVPYAPGVTDLEARKLAEGLSKELGQPFVVQNKAGAGGAIGAQFVANSKPDGYTFLYASPAVITIGPLTGNAPYKFEDLDPIARTTTSPHVLAASVNAPYKNGKDMVEYAKKNPGKVVFGSSGTGTAVHLAGEAFAAGAGIKVLHVPYKGLAPAITDVLGGSVDFVIGLPVAIKPQVDGGKLNAIAQFGSERSANLPNVPTLREIGVDLALSVNLGLFAPVGTPKDIIAKINAAAQKVLASPEYLEFAGPRMITPAFLPAADYSAIVKNERDLYMKIVPTLKLN
jgi:tripartite-type tricarboxylate transporter receptor subunit TctC